MSFLTGMLPMILRMLKLVFDKGIGTAEARRSFLLFVQDLQRQGLVSSDLYKQDIEQAQELQTMFNELHKKEGEQ